MNAKVDVLAVLDGAIAQTEYHNAERAHGGDAKNRRLREARAAVAELLKAGNALCDLMPGLAGGPEFDRFVAALANIGDTK